MKLLSKIGNIIMMTLVIITMIASIGTAITNKPILLSAVRSNSMYPLFERGDMIFISPIWSKNPITVNDIVIFNPTEGDLADKGWIVHRIISGDAENGYITKGDANEYIDQITTTPPILPSQIGGRAIPFGNGILKMPLVGFITLWLEDLNSKPFLMPALIIILLMVIIVSEFVSSSKKKKKQTSKALQQQLTYMITGLIISIFTATTIMMASSHVSLVYEVSNTNNGVIMGSSVGIMKVGETIEKDLSTLENKSFYPLIAAISCDDDQLSFNYPLLKLRNKQKESLTFKVTATTPGKYTTSIWIGMFYPFLPKNVIGALANQSFFLTVFILSLIPGLPIMLYPLFDRRLRNRSLKEMRKFNRKLIRVFQS